MKATNCPKCGSDNTQTFKMANRAGTSSGFAVGVGMTGGGDVGAGTGFGRQRSDIAKLTMPPKKEGGPIESIVLIILSIFIFNFVAVVTIWFFSVTGLGAFENLSALLIGLMVGAAVTIGFGIFSIRWVRNANVKREAAHKAAMMKWEHSWLCMRCGNIYYVR